MEEESQAGSDDGNQHLCWPIISSMQSEGPTSVAPDAVARKQVDPPLPAEAAGKRDSSGEALARAHGSPIEIFVEDPAPLTDDETVEAKREAPLTEDEPRAPFEDVGLLTSDTAALVVLCAAPVLAFLLVRVWFLK